MVAVAPCVRGGLALSASLPLAFQSAAVVILGVWLGGRFVSFLSSRSDLFRGLFLNKTLAAWAGFKYL